MTTDVQQIAEDIMTNQEEKEEVTLTIHDIPGVGAATAEKIVDGGFDTPLSIAVATPGQLVEAAGVGESVARKMVSYCSVSMDIGYESGGDDVYVG